MIWKKLKIFTLFEVSLKNENHNYYLKMNLVALTNFEYIDL